MEGGDIEHEHGIQAHLLSRETFRKEIQDDVGFMMLGS